MFKILVNFLSIVGQSYTVYLKYNNFVYFGRMRYQPSLGNLLFHSSNSQDVDHCSNLFNIVISTYNLALT